MAHCIITAYLAEDTHYLAAGPISQSFAIARAQLTVTADDQSMVYGGTVPSTTYSLSDFVNDETLATSGVTGSPECTIDAGPYTVSGSPDGISCTQGTISASKYGFTFVDGALTVTKATPTFISVSIDNGTYDGQPHGATASVSGVGDPAEALGSASVSYELRSGTDPDFIYGNCATTAPTDAGVYRVTFSYSSSANYDGISDDSHTLTISPATTAISAITGTATYGGKATLTATLTDTSNDAVLAGKTVAFKVGTADVGSATTDANGVPANWCDTAEWRH